jgi:hypothetical protein
MAAWRAISLAMVARPATLLKSRPSASPGSASHGPRQRRSRPIEPNRARPGVGQGQAQADEGQEAHRPPACGRPSARNRLRRGVAQDGLRERHDGRSGGALNDAPCHQHIERLGAQKGGLREAEKFPASSPAWRRSGRRASRSWVSPPPLTTALTTALTSALGHDVERHRPRQFRPASPTWRPASAAGWSRS